MKNENDFIIKYVSETLIIKSDKVAKILRENKRFILGLFKKYENDNTGLGSIYKIISKALFIRGIKAKNGGEVSIGTLTTTMKIIRDEK